MSTSEPPSRNAISNEVTIPDFYGIRGSTPARSYSPGVPGPAIFGNQSTPTRTEGIVLTIQLHNRRRVMDIWIPDLRRCNAAYQKDQYLRRGYSQYARYHLLNISCDLC